MDKMKTNGIKSERVFLDTSFLVPFMFQADKKHEYAIEAYYSFIKETPVINNTVLTETVNMLDKCNKGEQFTEQVIRTLLDKNIIMFMDWEDYNKSLEKFLFFGRKLNFNDCTILHSMEKCNIYKILTFDHHFQEKGVKILNKFIE